MAAGAAVRPSRIKITTAPLIELAAEILRGVPSLPNAACRDQGDLMDATTAADIATATALCRRCDDLERLSACCAPIPRVRQPAGVTAGVYRAPPPIDETRSAKGGFASTPMTSQ